MRRGLWLPSVLTVLSMLLLLNQIFFELAEQQSLWTWGGLFASITLLAAGLNWLDGKTNSGEEGCRRFNGLEPGLSRLGGLWPYPSGMRSIDFRAR